MRVRWRLNDPAEEGRPRWTMVHILHPGTAATATGTFGGLRPSDAEVSLCGRTVPEQPYMIDRDDQIPVGFVICNICRHRARRMGVKP